MIVVSKCLAGAFCRWDGGTNLIPEIRDMVAAGKAVAVCPEVLGGLPIPRNPSEIRNGRVFSSIGDDVTAEFIHGAEEALRICQELKCEYAVLKFGSPSCGCGLIHNGKFDGGLVAGNGIAAQLLMDHGITVLTEKEWQENHHGQHL